MIRINLLPVKELTAEVGRRQELVIASLILGLTVALAATLYVFQFYRLYGLGTEVASLKKEIEPLNVQLKEVGDLRQRVKALEQKIKVIDDLTKKRVGPVKVLESLSLATPSRLWLTEFKETGGNLTVSGLAVDNQTVADFHPGARGRTRFHGADHRQRFGKKTDQSDAPLQQRCVDLLYREAR